MTIPYFRMKLNLHKPRKASMRYLPSPCFQVLAVQLLSCWSHLTTERWTKLLWGTGQIGVSIAAPQLITLILEEHKAPQKRQGKKHSGAGVVDDLIRIP